MAADPVHLPLDDSTLLRQLPDLRQAVSDDPTDDPEPVARRPSASSQAVHAGHAQELTAALRRHVADAERQFLLMHPTATAGLRLRSGATSAFLREPRPAGATRIPLAILEALLEPGVAGMTQSAILKRVTPQFPQHTVPANIWHAVQAPWQLKTLRARIAQSPPPFSTSDVSRCRTLGEFKRALMAASAQASGSTFSVAVTVTEDAVTINGRTWRASTNRAQGREYTIVRIRLDQLLAAVTPEAGG